MRIALTLLVTTFLAVACATAASATAPTTTSQPAEDALLWEGLHLEQTLRQPKAAIAAYERVLSSSAASRSARARALVRFGICLERMGRSEQARQKFERVLDSYADERPAVDQALRRLAAISAGDPAALMPPETLFYVEIVRPGLQAERVASTLQGVDESGLQRLLAKLGIERDLRAIRATFTEAMREDINRIDSVALGVIALESLPGRIDARFLLALHPGKSLATRGVLALMAQSAGQADGAHGDAKLWALPDGSTGTFSFTNLRDRPGIGGLMLLGKDRDVVCRAIDRWRSGQATGTLSALPEFRRQASARRLDSAVLVYADVPRLLARLRQDMSDKDRRRYEASRRLLDLDAIERGMARVALLDNGLLLELSLMFNDKPNRFYRAFRTPPFDRDLLAFVPVDAVGALLLSMRPGADRLAQMDLFVEQVESLGRILSGRKGPGIEKAVQLVERATGLSIAEDIVPNCRSLALLLPEIGPGPSPITDSPVGNLVVVVRVADPDGFNRRIEKALLERVRKQDQLRADRDDNPQAVPPSTPMDRFRLPMARMADVFLFSLDKSSLEQVLTAHRHGNVIDRQEATRAMLADIPPSASKLLMVRPDRAANDVRALRDQPRYDFPSTAPIVCYTLEQARQLAVRVKVPDLTGLINNAIEAIGSGSLLDPSPPPNDASVAGQQPVDP